MKKGLIFIISFSLICAMMFSVFSMSVSAVTIKDSRVPLAGDVIFFDDDDNAGDTGRASPQTSDSMSLFVLVAGISLSAIATVGIMKKSRAK